MTLMSRRRAYRWVSALCRSCGVVHPRRLYVGDVSGEEQSRLLLGLPCMPLRKPVTVNGSSIGQSEKVGPGKVLTGWPNVLDFLSMSTWDDGSSRTLGTIRIFVEEGRWKLALNDPGNGRYAFLSGETPEDVLSAADDGLGDDTLDWRASKPWPGKGQKRS